MSRLAAAVLVRCAAMALPLLVAACSSGSKLPSAQGYVEGEFVRIAPEAAGRLVRLDVVKGAAIPAGAVLFALDDRDEQAALVEAEAQKSAAEAQLADLQTGKRAEEILVLDAQRAEAEATLDAAKKSYARNLTLTDKAVSSTAALDQAKADLDTATARVDAARHSRSVAELPARPDAIRAAEENVAALTAAVDVARIRLERRQRAAPAAGRIDDTYFRIGEMVPAGQPVVSLLPDSGRKIIFFVPEPNRASVHPGERVAIACDGCAAGLSAIVTSIASEAEFAPPVIYSTQSRAKLVFRVEARPEGAAASLEPGQPVDVTLAAE
ncbi:secretion protein HlyD [Kaistia algarum]|uniref:HlyD family secretion protein n=1 Tax=Kaistia algarum TaxID=2083279 RepID=UPI000CE935C4|nr:HlyD family efflux transporter periplasmic adaptor subunit [Kaistia algarum]MCX5513269.1 HlyD family efflux transporter periplasmic adaptor subunit [Kaistia algarum]PPE81271.1 secretion protein HlyD [Kaistia algarum]